MADDYQGIRLCPGVGRDCAGRFLRQLYVASELVYRVDVLATGSETRRIAVDDGKEHLLTVMEACDFEP